MSVLLPMPPLPSLPAHGPAAIPYSPADRLAVRWSHPMRSVPVAGRHVLGLRAGMAELVLLNRLRARTQRELSEDTLERAARLLEVTARDWLGEAPPCDKG